LEEDIQSGDHSTLSTIPADLVQSAKLLVRRLYFGWCRISRNYFKTFDKNLKVEAFIKDGENAKKDIAFIVTGKAQSILSTRKINS
jgi:nicotinate-nucleotide pyrophosphorylase (carboxylating)